MATSRPAMEGTSVGTVVGSERSLIKEGTCYSTISQLRGVRRLLPLQIAFCSCRSSEPELATAPPFVWESWHCFTVFGKFALH